MINAKTPKILTGISTTLNSVQCLSDIVHAWTEYKEIVQTEKTKRCEIKAWEKANLSEIQAKRDLLIGYLELSFDERTKNFQSLFQRMDQAILSGDNEQLGLILCAIVDLAKSSPFKDLADLSKVKTALADPDHVWEF